VQGGLRAGAAGFAQGYELGRDFDEQDFEWLELRPSLDIQGSQAGIDNRKSYGHRCSDSESVTTKLRLIRISRHCWRFMS
jgi:hypothetical protein